MTEKVLPPGIVAKPKKTAPALPPGIIPKSSYAGAPKVAPVSPVVETRTTTGKGPFGMPMPVQAPRVRRLNPGEFIQNDDGTRSTELGLTITNPRINQGKPTNIPSIWHVDGKIVKADNEHQAIDYAVKSGEAWDSYGTIDEAVAASKARSAKGGRFQDAAATDVGPMGMRIPKGIVKARIADPWNRGSAQMQAGLGAAASRVQLEKLQAMDAIDRMLTRGQTGPSGFRSEAAEAELDKALPRTGEQDPLTFATALGDIDILEYARALTPQERAAVRQRVEGVLGSQVGEVVSGTIKAASIPKNPSVARAQQAKSFGEFWDAFSEAPGTFITDTVIESAPNMIPTVVGGALGGPAGGRVGFAAGAGAGSGVVELGSSIAQKLQELGADMEDPESIRRVLEEHEAEIFEYARNRAVAVGLFDALGARIAAGKMIPGRPVAEAVGQTVAGAGSGVGGEIGAARLNDEDVNVGAAMSEGIGEVAGQVTDIGSAGAQGLRTQQPPVNRRDLERFLAEPPQPVAQPAPAPQPPQPPEIAAPASATPGDGTATAPRVVATPEDLTEASSQAATSPMNARPEPTEAQKAAGNYPKAHVKVQGLDISIENPKGSTRSGTGPEGTWSVTMPAHYGYIRRSEGADGDQVDVFIGDQVDAPEAYVIDQIDPATGEFDEAKIVMGVPDMVSAIQTYDESFSGGGQDRIGAVTPLSVDELKTWIKSGDTKKPIGNIAAAQKVIRDKLAEQQALAAQPEAAPAVPNQTQPAPSTLPKGIVPKASRGRKNAWVSITGLAKKMGGLKDVGGDLRSMDMLRLRPGVINNRSGIDLDKFAEALFQMPEWRDQIQSDNDPDTWDTKKVVALMGEELSGRAVAPRGEESAAADAQGAREEEAFREKTWQSANAHTQTLLGRDLDKTEFEAILKKYVTEGYDSIEDAVTDQLESDIIADVGAMESRYGREEEVQARSEEARPGDRDEPPFEPGSEGPSAGAQADARGAPGRDQDQGLPRQQGPKTELTDQGEQTVMPGMERSAKQAAQARDEKRGGKMGTDKAQTEPGGMFEPKPDDRQTDIEGFSNTGKGGGVQFVDMTLAASMAVNGTPRQANTQAAEWTVKMGKQTGREYAVALDAQGKVVSASSGTQDVVVFDQKTSEAFNDPANSFIVHHNHPSPAALSNTDIYNLAKPGVGFVVANNHDGTFTAARIAPDARDQVMRTIGGAEVILREAHDRAWFLLQVIVDPIERQNAVMHALAGAGLIDYHTSMKPRAGFASLVRQAAGTLRKELANVGWNFAQDTAGGLRRPAVYESSAGAMAAISRLNAESAAGRRALSATNRVGKGSGRLESGRREGSGARADPAAEGTDSEPARGPSPATLAHPAWHGSPHKGIEKFSTSKIGTGEGALAYGWGLYFASNKAIAEWYRRQLSRRHSFDGPTYKGKTFVKGDGSQVEWSESWLADWGKDAEWVLKFAVDNNLSMNQIWDAFQKYKKETGFFKRLLSVGQVEPVIDAMEQKGWKIGPAKTGALYKVELAPTEDQYLDWDRPINQQSATVKAAIDKIAPSILETINTRMEDEGYNGLEEVPSETEHYSGKGLYNLLKSAEMHESAIAEAMNIDSPNEPKEAVSRYLLSLGIRGNRYLDASSRGDKGTTSNYVIFDENDISISEAAAFEMRTFGNPNAGNIAIQTAGQQVQLDILKQLHRPGWRAAAERRLRSFRLLWRDRFATMADIEKYIEGKTGQKTPAAKSFYKQEEVFTGKVADQLQQFHEGMLKELYDAMHDTGLSVKEIEKYLVAKHAPERNATIAAINPLLPDGGSGMTNAQAQAVIDAFNNRGKLQLLQRVSDAVKKIRRFDLDTRIRAGLIQARDVAEKLRDWPNYVPLKGFEELFTDDELVGRARPRLGSGFSVKNREYFSAMGRSSEAQNILANLISQAEESVVRAEKTKVAQVLADFVTANPDPSFWNVDLVTTKRVIDPDTGLVVVQHTRMPSLEDEEQFVIYFKKGGQLHRIWIANPRLVANIRNMSANELPKWTKALQLFGTIFRAVNVNMNPEFIIPNAARDLQTGLVQALQHKAPGLKRKMVKYWPQAAKASWGGYGGKQGPAGTWLGWYRRMARAGGKVDFFNIDDIESQVSSIEGEMRRRSGSALGRGENALRGIYKLIDRANHSVENAVRLAAFRAMVEAGFTDAEAASVSKNITVNFNRRGEVSRWANLLWPFFNAAVQGTFTLGSAAARSGKVRGALIGLTMMGFAEGMVNGLLSAGGDDDEDESDFDKIPEHIRRKNIIIMNPGYPKNGGPPYWQLPIGYGLNVFWNAGREMSDIALGKKTIGEALGNVGVSAADAFIPIDIDSLTGLLPSFAQAPGEVLANKDFSGKPVYREPSETEARANLPDSSITRPGTNEFWKALASGLNKMSGGSEYEPGLFDFHPESMEHIFKTYAGGVGSIISRTSDLIGPEPGDSFELGKVPVIRKVIGYFPRSTESNRYYENRGEIQEAAGRLKAAEESGDDAAAERFATKGERQLGLEGELKASEKRLTALRKEAREVRKEPGMPPEERKAALQAIYEEMDAETSGFNKTFYQEIERPRQLERSPTIRPLFEKKRKDVRATLEGEF